MATADEETVVAAAAAAAAAGAGKALELPSVEDRTLFLACLTCTVASAYDFDLTVEGTADTAAKNNNSGETDDDDDSATTDDEGSETIEFHPTTTPPRLPPPPPQLKHESSAVYLDAEDEEDEDEKFKNDGSAEVADELERENRLLEHNIQRAIKIQEKMALAEQRHFVRRYKVAKAFILKSSEHLLLQDDPKSLGTVTKELLPMLDTLLEDHADSAVAAVGGGGGGADNGSSSSGTKLMQKAMMKTSHSGDSLNSLDQYVWLEKKNDNLQKYLSKLSPQSAYQCLGWLLFQHLLNAEDGGGYDARIRFWFKSLAVTLWMKEFEQESKSKDNNDTTTKARLLRATKKFESLETCCAERLLSLAAAQGKKSNNNNPSSDNGPQQQRKSSSSLGSNIWKGVQIGSVGVGAGILLAVTGGLAAPGIAYGLAVMGMGAVGSAFLSLASSAAVVSLFGVAGGSLAAYKMNRRVSGLTEFTIQQELIGKNDKNNNKGKQQTPQLYRSLAISGWLQDKSDFQRPWGVTPTNPPIKNKVELLQRFYHIYNPPLVEDAAAIWRMHKNNPDKLWRALQNKYGCNPNTTQNIFSGSVAATTAAASKHDGVEGEGLTPQEIQTLDQIIVAIGKVKGGEDDNATPTTTAATNKDSPSKDDNNGKKKKKKKEKKTSKRMSVSEGATALLKGWGSSNKKDNNKSDDDATTATTTEEGTEDTNSLLRGWGSISVKDKTTATSTTTTTTSPSNDNIRSEFEIIKSGGQSNTVMFFDQFAADIMNSPVVGGGDEPFEPPSHLITVWDYPQHYGGELYTVKWESDLLDELGDSMKKQVLELTSSATQQVLKVTVASTLIFAAAIPLTIVGALNAIDGTWTLVMDRADEAGKELAQSLLLDKSGHRPITLMGYSFGARIIYVALKELAQYQQKWEEHVIELRKSNSGSKQHHQQQQRGDSATAATATAHPAVCCRVGDLEFDREPASIVEDVITMGMPKYLSLNGWKACREVVAGRLVNVYSRNDKVLSYMFKFKNLLGSYQPVVGTCTVAVPGVENIDVTDMISSHEDYSHLTGKILERVRLGQPVRSSSNAIDEIALLEEAKNMVAKEEEEQKQQQQQQRQQEKQKQQASEVK